MTDQPHTTDDTEDRPKRYDPRTGELLDERKGIEFLDLVGTHRKGAMNLDVTEALDELCKSVMDIGKTGTLTITITVEPIESETDIILGLLDEVKIRPPKRKGTPSFYYAQTEDGQIDRNAPQQTIYDHMSKD